MVLCFTGAHSVGRTHCVKLVHRLYPEVDPALNPDHLPHMFKKCPDPIPDPKAVQYVRNDRGTPMVLDNNYYRNILDNKGLLIVDHQLANDKRTKPYVKKMAKSQDYFFREFSKAITKLSENNPLTGSKGEIRKQCNVANKHSHEEEPWTLNIASKSGSDLGNSSTLFLSWEEEKWKKLCNTNKVVRVSCNICFDVTLFFVYSVKLVLLLLVGMGILKDVI